MVERVSQPLPATAFLPYLRLRLRSLRDLVDRILARTRPTEDDLHDLHRELRRLRVLARLAGRLARKDRADRTRSLDARLSRLSRMVGAVRDLDVLLALTERYDPRRREPSERSVLAALRTRLREDAGTGRELLRATLRAQRDAGLFEEADRILSTAGRRVSRRRLSRVLGEEHRIRFRAASRARKRSVKRPTAERLHDVRVHVRRWRYLTDLGDALRGTSSPTFPRRLVRLQQRLGELHDHDVLAGRLDEFDPRHRSTDWSKALLKERRTLRRAVLDELAEIRLNRLADRSIASANGR